MPDCYCMQEWFFSFLLFDHRFSLATDLPILIYWFFSSWCSLFCLFRPLLIMYYNLHEKWTLTLHVNQQLGFLKDAWQGNRRPLDSSTKLVCWGLVLVDELSTRSSAKHLETSPKTNQLGFQSSHPKEIGGTFWFLSFDYLIRSVYLVFAEVMTQDYFLNPEIPVADAFWLVICLWAPMLDLMCL